MKTDSKVFGLLITGVLVVLAIALLHWRPGYFSNVRILGGVLLLQVVLVTVWHYERWFFAVMMLLFLWAGTDLPLASVGTQARWIFLAVGALIGIVKWLQLEGKHRLTAIHLVALLCAMSAVVSSLVSRRMELSLLKSISLVLLFLYGSFGARVAVTGRENAFFSGLVRACEITAYASAFFYWGLHFEVFGNPNSLGAIMGIVVAPVLLWALLATGERAVRHRRAFALLLAVGLLYSSVSRAGILACIVAFLLMCVALHQHHLLIKGAFVAVFLSATVAVLWPARFDGLVNAFTEDLIYKGKHQQGILGSRESPWQDAINAVKENPWFGSGFGTDVVELLPGTAGGIVFSTNAGLDREHGNSYLALLGYVGLLGLTPFVFLFLLIFRVIYRSCSRMWRTRELNSFVVPLVLVCVAGLVHAFFEDWLFAVGFHLNVFFWSSVFVLADLQSGTGAETASLARAWNSANVRTRPIALPSTR